MLREVARGARRAARRPLRRLHGRTAAVTPRPSSKPPRPAARLLGIDADPDALGMARSAAWRASAAPSPSCRATSATSTAICRERGFAPVNGILFDLGLSSHQLASATGASASASSRRWTCASAPIRRRPPPTGSTRRAKKSSQTSSGASARSGRAAASPAPSSTAVRCGRPLDLAKAVEQAVGRRPGSQIPPRHQDVSGSPHRRQPGTSQPG